MSSSRFVRFAESPVLSRLRCSLGNTLGRGRRWCRSKRSGVGRILTTFLVAALVLAPIAQVIPSPKPASAEFHATPMVAAGYDHTVGLKSDGTVVAVGANFYGQCDVSSWTGIAQVAAGCHHTVGLKSDGTLVAVGVNSDGQCDVSSWTGIVQVAAGYYHTVGLKSDGTVVTVGANNYRQGNVSSWSGIVQVAAGYYHTVGLKSDGTVVAAGAISYGQGNVSSWSGIVQVAAGDYHAAGLKSDGTVVAVGDNSYGQCNVSPWSGIVQVAAGLGRTEGLKSDGTVVVVGMFVNTDHAMNLGAAIPKLTSIAVTPIAPANLAAGGTQQFTATATYSDYSTANITSQVTWHTSNTGIGTISSSGLATGVAPGSTSVTASLSGITSNSVTLSVVAPTPAGESFLAFPLGGKTPWYATVSSVFDHSMSTPYSADGVVVAFTGETGESRFGKMYVATVNGAALYGFSKDDAGTVFRIVDGYTGGAHLCYDGHPGYDYPVSVGTEVRAAAGGTVIAVDSAGSTDAGKYVKIQHPEGYQTLCMHLSEVLVSLGANVTRGQVIAKSGNTGNSNGPHLHFEVRKQSGSSWVPADPYGWQGSGIDPYAIQNVNLWLTPAATLSPAVEDVNPGSGKQQQHLTVTISGANFGGASSVSFGLGIAVEDFNVEGSTEITAEITVDANAAKGIRDVSVTTGYGSGTKTDGFEVVGSGGGICGGGAPVTPDAPSEMTTVLTALGVLLGVGYLLMMRGARNSRSKVRA